MQFLSKSPLAKHVTNFIMFGLEPDAQSFDYVVDFVRQSGKLKTLSMS